MVFTTSKLNAELHLAITVVLLLGLIVPAISQNPSDDVRGIKSREYARRIQDQVAKRRPRANRAKPKTVARYVAVANDNAPVAEGLDVGVTLWRLRPAQKADPQNVQEPKRIVVRKKGQSEEKTVMMVPARAESETVFADGDLLKMSIEPPFESYIYIINREQYKDGSYSEPYLIFPEKSDADRNGKGFPGKLVFLPSENDDDKFEVTQLTRDGAEKVAEVFTVVLSRQPIKELPPLETSDVPRRIDKQQFEHWQNEWSGRAWKFEKQGSADTSITRVEKTAGAKVGARLTESDPYPQTVYHIERKSTDILLFDVSLKIRK